MCPASMCTLGQKMRVQGHYLITLWLVCSGWTDWQAMAESLLSFFTLVELFTDRFF